MQLCFAILHKGIFVDKSEIFSDCLWSFSWLAETDDDRQIEFIAQTDILHEVCSALGQDELFVFVPALKAIGSVFSANDPSIIDRALWCNSLGKLGDLMKKMGPDNQYMKEACWALSNVTASTAAHIEKTVESSCYPLLIEVALYTKRVDTRKEALWAICNAATGSISHEVLIRMIEQSSSNIINALVIGCTPTQD